jgi:hypothetical protein
MTVDMGHSLARALLGAGVLIASACGAAPAPAGTGRSPDSIDGVQLVATDATLTEACTRAAGVLQFTVPCPGLIPLPRTPVGCPTIDISEFAGGKDCAENSGAGVAPKGVLDIFTFIEPDMVLPSSYMGTGPGANHLFIIGVRADSKLVAFRAGCAGEPEAIRPGPIIFGAQASWVDCGPEGAGMHSGHRMLRWAADGVLYVVSLHGQTAINERLEQVIANGLVMVAPKN